MRETILFQTDDHVQIAADVYPADKGKGLLLLHMMPATRASFRQFAPRAQRAGFSTLAIDLRGHGDSTQTFDGREIRYEQFSDADYQASQKDVAAAFSFFRARGVLPPYAVLGASIGANLALQALATDSDVAAAALLSPGYAYRGIETLPLARRVRPGAWVLYAASRDDIRSGGDAADVMAKDLFDATPDGVHKDIKIFDHAGHGTTIFEREPAFMDDVVAWLIGAMTA